METTFAVANKILRLAEDDSNPISHMKLQKLVYLSYGWHLGLDCGPLTNERVSAWEYGPIFTSLYYEFIGDDGDPIRRYAEQLLYTDGGIILINPTTNDESADEVIERVWEVYGNYTAVQLSNLCHAHNTPWQRIAFLNPIRLSRKIGIPDELIYEYFKKLRVQ